MNCCNKKIGIQCSSNPDPKSDKHWYTPMDVGNFGIKNIPNEVECLVAKEAKLLTLDSSANYSLLSSVPFDAATDLSNAVVASTVGGIAAGLNGLQISNQ